MLLFFSCHDFLGGLNSKYFVIKEGNDVVMYLFVFSE